jgi:hypothetical protein
MKTQYYWFESEFFILFYFCWCVCVCVWKHNQRSNQQALGSSVGQFFEVLKNRQFGSLIFQNQRITSSSSLKNIQNQRIVYSSCFKKTSKNGWSS